MSIARFALALTAAATVAGSAQAATVASWSSFTPISSNADIINPGNVLSAINLGSDTADVNVTTSAGTIVFKNGGFGGAGFRSDGFFVDNNPDIPSVTGDFNSDFHRVLDSFRDNAASGYTFTGLADGTYYVQVFVSEDRADRNRELWVVHDKSGPNEAIAATTGSVNISQAAFFRSAYAIATVTLTGGEGKITVQDSAGGNTPVNAIVLSQAPAVPEPGSLALMGLGGLLIAARRRRA